MEKCPSINSETVVICKEIFEENRRPTQEEIAEYATRIGIDCQTEQHLIPVAEDGLLQPLPLNWVPCYDITNDTYFYFNAKSNISQWDHPLDNIYRRLVQDLRTQHFSADNTPILLKREDCGIKSDSIVDKMLPLRQNRKPQLVPIKQLLMRTQANERPFSSNIEKSSNILKQRPRSHSLSLRSKTGKSTGKTVRFQSDETDIHDSFSVSSHLNDRDHKNFSTKNQNWLDAAIDDSRIPSSVHIDIDSLDSPQGNRSSSPISQIRSLYGKGYNESTDISDRIKTLSESPKRSYNLYDRPSKNLRNKGRNTYNADSAFFSGSNIDDTSKIVLSDFSNTDTSSSNSEIEHGNLVSLGINAVDIKAKEKQNAAVEKRDLISDPTRKSNIEQELVAKLHSILNVEVEKIKDNFRSELEEFVQKVQESIKQEQLVVLENHEKVFQSLLNKAVEKINLCMIQETTNVTNEPKLKDQNLHDMEKLKETLIEELKTEKERINIDISHCYEESLNKIRQYTENRLDTCKLEMKNIFENSDKNVYNTDYMDRYTKDIQNIRDDLLKEIQVDREHPDCSEKSTKVAQQYTDQKIQNLMNVVNEKTNGLEDRFNDCQEKYRQLNTEMNLNRNICNEYKQNLQAFLGYPDDNQAITDKTFEMRFKTELCKVFCSEMKNKEVERLSEVEKYMENVINNVISNNAEKYSVLLTKNKQTQDTFVQTRAENGYSKQEEIKLISNKMDQLLLMTNNLSYNVSALTRMQEDIKEDNDRLRIKHTSLENKYDQLINLTDISISDLKLDIPGFIDCSREERGRKFNETIDTVFKIGESQNLISPLKAKLDELDWRITHSFGTTSYKDYAKFGIPTSSETKIMGDIERDLNCSKQKHIYNFTNTF